MSNFPNKSEDDTENMTKLFEEILVEVAIMKI